MLNKILNNLKMYPEDECYEINDKVYKNKDLYKYVCNIYNYLLKNNPNRKSVIVYGHKDIYMIASFLACSFAGMAYIPVDESIPNERRKKIVEQVKPNVILDKKIEKTLATFKAERNRCKMKKVLSIVLSLVMTLFLHQVVQEYLREFKYHITMLKVV